MYTPIYVHKCHLLWDICRHVIILVLNTEIYCFAVVHEQFSCNLSAKIPWRCTADSICCSIRLGCETLPLSVECTEELSR